MRCVFKITINKCNIVESRTIKVIFCECILIFKGFSSYYCIPLANIDEYRPTNTFEFEVCLCLSVEQHHGQIVVLLFSLKERKQAEAEAHQ